MNAKLMDAMLQHGVGLNPWFFERNAGSHKFPPHDITQIGEDRYRLTLAVAGFTRDDLKITLQGEHLTISGNRPPEKPNGGSIEHKVLYRGIAYRDFTREFMIGEHVHIELAKLEHGLLEIDLLRQLPEVQKLKQIQIMP
jgi:molecular chaperone IbpA